MLCFSFLFLKEIVSSDDKSSEEILEFKNRRRDFDAVGEEKEEEEKDISKRFEDNACIGPDRNPTRFRRSGAFVKYGRKETIRFGMENIFYDGRNIPSSPPFRPRKTWSTVYSVMDTLAFERFLRKKMKKESVSETMKNSSTIPKS